MPKKTRKVGRPTLPNGKAMARIVPVRFKPEEFRAINKAAKASKQTVSQWVRSTLNANVKPENAP
jgi:predicted HicB family RNase H-like nuclease